ncbi:hypothetical protein CKK33_02340 [Mucilaginibacter sp. MD40]|uniref:hypothetical protein n=1 Tax=Mucilaginibacter sp. MD40 TaxID=2029590 RepID=UPI000BACBE3C|nr:hypothetical protein [Mucilaginibacter sp. MD40]PAW92394.1 hypothetical protein CKK33_02340 [Mucilaginibacter sp. MD40]
MDNSRGYVKGQRVTTPEGEGDVLEVIGDEIKVKLSSGDVRTFAEADLHDDSAAGLSNKTNLKT